MNPPYWASRTAIGLNLTIPNRRLDHAITNPWNPQGPLLPIGLGNEDATHRNWTVPVCLQFLLQGAEKQLHPTCLDGLDGLSVNAGRTAVATDLVPCDVEHLL